MVELSVLTLTLTLMLVVVELVVVHARGESDWAGNARWEPTMQFSSRNDAGCRDRKRTSVARN